MKFSENEAEALYTIEYNSFNQVFLDLDQFGVDLRTIVSDTQEGIATCRALATPEAVDACYDALSSLFSVLKDDILNRISELYKLGNSALQISEDNVDQFSAENREFVKNSALTARGELVKCIQSP